MLNVADIRHSFYSNVVQLCTAVYIIKKLRILIIKYLSIYFSMFSWRIVK